MFPKVIYALLHTVIGGRKGSPLTRALLIPPAKLFHLLHFFCIMFTIIGSTRLIPTVEILPKF